MLIHDLSQQKSVKLFQNTSALGRAQENHQQMNKLLIIRKKLLFSLCYRDLCIEGAHQ